MEDQILEGIVAYYADPERFECPEALSTSRMLGDYRMIVQGGIWDQPWGEWLAARYAGYIAYLVDEEAAGRMDGLSDSGKAMILDKIMPCRMRLAEAGHHA